MALDLPCSRPRPGLSLRPYKAEVGGSKPPAPTGPRLVGDRADVDTRPRVGSYPQLIRRRTHHMARAMSRAASATKKDLCDEHRRNDRAQVTDDPALDVLPSWSPDGTALALVSERDGNQEIYVVGADGTGVTGLTDAPAEDGDPVWSPTG
jgi:WD40-like Beta Propeller Repeat